MDMESSMKKEIDRNYFKNNFLKKIIVRFDFTGVLEQEIEENMPGLQSKFKAKGYDEFRNEYSSEIDFQVEDPEFIEVNGLPVNEIRKQKSYVYRNSENGIEIKISAWYAYVSVENKNYVSFSEYSRDLTDAVNSLKEHLSFINFTRFGIRKINQCIIKDLDLLNHYFEKEYYQMIAKEHGYLSKLYQTKDCYMDGDYNVNLIRTVITGEYEGKPAYQVILDADVYITGNKIEDLLKDESYIKDMNSNLFELYKASITDDFIKKLGHEDFYDKNIIGVARNE